MGMRARTVPASVEQIGVATAPAIAILSRLDGFPRQPIDERQTE